MQEENKTIHITRTRNGLQKEQPRMGNEEAAGEVGGHYLDPQRKWRIRLETIDKVGGIT